MAANKINLKGILEGIGGAALIAGTVVFSPLLRPWYRKWGTQGAEAQRPLPGDDFVPHPKSEITQAITVQAPAAQVWPWFVQLGCQRAGWYSYDLLDNGAVPSADQIIPEFQHLEVGDVVKAVPKGDFGFPVAVIVPGKALSLAGTLDTTNGNPADPHDPNLKAYFSGDQTFFLEDVGGKSTRLIFRMRTDWNATVMNNIIYRGIVEPISFVMGRKTLYNVKRLAEKVNGGSHAP